MTDSQKTADEEAAAALHGLTDSATQAACNAIGNLSRSLSPWRSVGPRRNDLKWAHDQLSAAMQHVTDAIEMLS